MTTTTLLVPLERLLNRGLQASTPARERLPRLLGRSLAIVLHGADAAPLLRIRLTAQTDALTLTADDEPASASISGTPGTLARLLAGGETKSAATSGLRIEGEAEVAQHFEQLLRHARPDLGAELARLVGDTPAEVALSLFTRLARGATHTARSLARSTAEYLTEERRDVVSAGELEVYFRSVDTLRDDLARFEARLARLEKSTTP
jgi:ubiquinone biosynthesis accessory factor UbiJ